MSRHRINPKAGWAKPDGKCRWCGVDGLKGQSTFCSAACVHEWKIRSQPGYVRHLVGQRDKGVCAACGLDTQALMERCRGKGFYKTQEQRDLLVSHGINPGAIYAGDYWQADHIVEVVNGGGQCGLENYQTLCTRCHKAKTRRLVHERTVARRLAAESARQPLLKGSS